MTSSNDRLRNAVCLPDGALVRGRGVEGPLPEGALPQFGLYLGVNYLPPWDSVRVRWPNYLLPRDFDQTARLITAAHSKAVRGDRVEVACNAGRGRTGTVLACMAVLAGVPPKCAIGWVRTDYDPHALRAPWQRWWVHWFARQRTDA